MKILAGLSAYFVALTLLTSSANAATLVKSVFGSPDPGDSGNVVITFDDALPAGIVFAPGSSYSILQGLVPHRGYNPAGDQTKYLSVPGTGVSGSATLDFAGFAGAITDFSFYWGSIDRANQLTITTDLGSLVVMGSDVNSAGFGNATSARDNRRVFFDLANGETLKSISFTSPTAFEIDDLVMNAKMPVPSVPEPATWEMMIAGFAGIGTVLRLRRHERFALVPSV